MYDVLDRPVTCLHLHARFLLWAMRGWAVAVERRTCPPLALSRGFASIGAQAALPEFHVSLALVNRQGRSAMALAPIECPRIVEDEAILLALWRDLALARFEQVRTMLSLIVDIDGQLPVRRALCAASAKLAMSGCDISHLTLSAIEAQNDE